MKIFLLSIGSFLLFSCANAQNWTKISGIMDNSRVYDLSNINNKVVLGGTQLGNPFPPIGTYAVSNDGGNTWSATETIEYGLGLLDALPMNNIFTTYSSLGGVQSQQLTGNTWNNFSDKLKFAEFSNGVIIGGAAGGADTVYTISNTGVVGEKINSSRFNLGSNGDYMVAANNRMFFFRNGASGLYGGEFSYIDYSDLSSFKTPLTLDGNAMTSVDWRDLVGVTDMVMMENGDLLATSAEMGLIKSVDNGLNWTSLNSLFGGAGNFIFKNSVGHLYALVGFGAVAVSTDNGITFTNINGNLAPQIGGQSLFQNLFVNSLDEVFVVINNQESNSSVPENSGIYKLDGVGASVEDIASKQFEIFPNPASNFLTFKNVSSSKAEVSILNLLGDEVLNFSAKDALNIVDISNQSAGIYFLKATINGHTQTQKFIIQ